MDLATLSSRSSSPMLATCIPVSVKPFRVSGSLSAGPSPRAARFFCLMNRCPIWTCSFAAKLRQQLADLHRSIGATSLYVTHDQVEAMTLADQVVVMNAGRIEQIGTPQEIYDQPASEFVACFVGSPQINLVDAIRTGPMLHLLGDPSTIIDLAAVGPYALDTIQASGGTGRLFRRFRTCATAWPQAGCCRWCATGRRPAPRRAPALAY